MSAQAGQNSSFDPQSPVAVFTVSPMFAAAAAGHVPAPSAYSLRSIRSAMALSFTNHVRFSIVEEWIVGLHFCSMISFPESGNGSCIL
jgi:hypothetical protein